MLRPLQCILLLAWVVLTWGCGDKGSPSASGGIDGGDSAFAHDSLFADRGLEAAVRAALGRPEGEVTQAELSSLKDLDASGLEIKDLAGIGRLDSLQSLNLADNEVTDLSPLAALVQLEYLDLSHNQVTGVSALASLAQLKVLILEQNAVPDLSPLQGLSHLERLELTEGMVESAATTALQVRGVNRERNKYSGGSTGQDLEPGGRFVGTEGVAGAEGSGLGIEPGCRSFSGGSTWEPYFFGADR